MEVNLTFNKCENVCCCCSLMFTDITKHDGLPWAPDYYTLHMKCPHCLMLWRLGSHRRKKFCKRRMQLEIINHDGSSPRESFTRRLPVLFSTLYGPRRGVSATHSPLQLVLPKYMDPIDHDPLKPWAEQSFFLVLLTSDTLVTAESN